LLVELERLGFDTSVAGDGGLAVQLLAEIRPALLVVDLDTPEMPPIETVRRLTSAGMLALAASDGMPAHHLRDAGADDYIERPFLIDDLLDRVEGLCRGRAVERAPIRFESTGDHEVSRHLVAVDGEPLRLTRTEWEILRCLASRSGQAVAAEELLEIVWGPAFRSEWALLAGCLERLKSKLAGGRREPVIDQPSAGSYCLAAS
jgi:two-component system KDP operon response regulator KdpE